ncbi:uncharacterized protein OGAPODRAFT_93189 [Ogataea polymorpha]|uniref:uncharacterized protein n=1 Tax=Ogataea polymorpha TaxID=460523 RepID=UPI0007F43D05|nr:uncharacterized protein OGAPODRAFT_93189 [Ogataea polymorpha]OBA16173.1 hypothetical protein OGAPODRAFT_93189 [Ogataea polymorpha]
MAIAPIQGFMKRRIITDISIGIGSGLFFGSLWWWGYHKPAVAKREAYYAELAKKKEIEDSA